MLVFGPEVIVHAPVEVDGEGVFAASVAEVPSQIVWVEPALEAIGDVVTVKVPLPIVGLFQIPPTDVVDCNPFDKEE